MELKDLVGKHLLQGIELGTEPNPGQWRTFETREFILFTLDRVTYKAIEDPDDGYRSYMEDLEIVEEVPRTSIPDVEVLGTMRAPSKWEDNDVIEFLDTKNGLPILAIGTGNTNDYYPYCVLEYTPENMACNDEVRKCEGD